MADNKSANTATTEKKAKRTAATVVEEQIQKAVERYNKKLEAVKKDEDVIKRLRECLTILNRK